ncbi:MAG: phosphatidylserine decarboxylase [Bryobacterales bacterium]|nr:phosphatidylserine decarboxylase [Bryobacterales bacterium]MDE0295475.1 phosphatidylserine decarboxylase [Bryobacterales bacterium]MDE0436596.1 phosphatidylserine decarboxylase [Bryobacterales bacterium]
MGSLVVKDGLYYALAFSAAGVLVGLSFSLVWSLPLLLATAFCLYFFRDPERAIPEGPVAVSPADGRVVQVRTYDDESRRVSIFLNIFDVHVNRSPIEGTVTEREYRAGRFMMAHRDEASLENEQNTLAIEGQGSRVIVRQIAGLVARRIVCNKQIGDPVEKGERFGLIKFGSRTDIFLGPEWELSVREGDRVHGGSSILARRRLEQAA